MTDSIKMTCFLTKNGWEMTAENADSDKVWQSSLGMQHSYLEVLDSLSAMKPRSQATAYFKLVLRFKPAKKGTRITLDYKTAVGAQQSTGNAEWTCTTCFSKSFKNNSIQTTKSVI